MTDEVGRVVVDALYTVQIARKGTPLGHGMRMLS